MLAILSVLIFVTYVIKTAPVEELRKVIVDNSREGISKIELEEGSLVNEREFLTYLSFSSTLKSPQKIVNELIAEGAVESIDSDQLLIKKDFKIEGLINNSCDRVYCFQHRLSFQNIPGYLWKGLIGIEDRRFLEHKGVDYISLARALIHDISVMKFEQGGSTLTQQLIKNLFFTNEKKISRKIKEFILSYYVENSFEKEKILEAYFNEVFWGSMQGIRIKGIYAASLFYFSKPVSSLKPYEVAILIGMLKGPYYYSPFKYQERLKTRAQVVYKTLIELNLFPKDKNYAWTNDDWVNWFKKLEKNKEGRDLRSIWRATVDKSEHFNNYEKFVLINKSEKILNDLKEKNKNGDFAIKVLNYKLEKPLEKYEYYSKYELSKEEAINQTKHQIGSTVKPILYKIFLSLGKEMSDTTDTSPITLKLISGEWSPKEGRRNLNKTVSLEQALKSSMNRPLIKISKELGFENIEKELSKYIETIKKPLSEYPSQLLGSIELSLYELGKAYSKLLIDECYGKGGDVLKTLIDPNQTTISRRVNKKLRNLSFFGKTGTSNNGLDNWFVGFDGRDVTIIWTGHEGNRDIKDLKLYGGTTSFEVFNSFFRDRGRRFADMSCPSLNNTSPN